jgi:AbrB family looped-hinge helix DNA binding protein
MNKTRVTSKGQIVIPVELRRKYGIKAGTRIIVSEKDDLIILKPITDHYLKKLQGSLKGSGALRAFLDDKRFEM